MLAYRQVQALVDVYGLPRTIDYRPHQPIVEQPAVETDHFAETFPEEPETKLPSFLTGTFRFVAVTTGACAVLYVLSTAAAPQWLVSVTPTAIAPRFYTVIPANNNAQPVISNTEAVASPGSAMTARPFRTFTPSPQIDEQAAILVEAAATSTATLTPIPLPVTTVPTVLAPPTVQTEAVTSSRFGIIDTNVNINVRQTASTQANVVAVLQPDIRIEIIDENADGSWFQVRLEDGREGWVAARLVRIE